MAGRCVDVRETSGMTGSYKDISYVFAKVLVTGGAPSERVTFTPLPEASRTEIDELVRMGGFEYPPSHG
jgi:hypothetical protein